MKLTFENASIKINNGNDPKMNGNNKTPVSG
jgi:hypothetical protein